jgi:hypothetical protein
VRFGSLVRRSDVSQDVLSDSILALGLGIAFYYALTGFACVIYFRRRLLTSAGSFFFLGLLPGLGGLMMVLLFVKSCFDLIGDPLFIGLGALLAGAALMIACQFAQPAFFRRKPEVATS